MKKQKYESVFTTDDFYRQQREWYIALKEIGFEDIEQKVNNTPSLKEVGTFAFRNMHSWERVQARANYYLRLSQCAENEEFESSIESFVMRQASQGIKIIEIYKGLLRLGYKTNYSYSYHRQEIRFIIRKYESKWKIRNWKKSQLTK